MMLFVCAAVPKQILLSYLTLRVNYVITLNNY